MKTDKVLITNEKLNLFVLCAKQYLMEAPESVLKEVVEDVLEPAIKRLKKYERGIELLRVQYCKKTATKHIEKDKNNQYQYTEEDHKKLLSAADALGEATVELPVIMVDLKDVPKDGLTYDIRSAFEGVVIAKRPRKFEEEEAVETEE